MDTTANAFLYLINLSKSFLVIIFLARLLFQFCSMPMQNPIALFIAKFTEPVVSKLRFIFPTIKRFNFAALLVIVLINFVALYFERLLFGVNNNSIAVFVSSIFITLPLQVLNFFFWTIIIGVIFSWLPNAQFHPLVQVVNVINRLILSPIQNILPNTSGFDISPIIALIVIGFLERLLTALT